jgi:uncharacterized protein (TIGR03083 family)
VSPDQQQFTSEDARLVLSAAEESAEFLMGATDSDWARPIPGMDWDVLAVVTHMTGALVWYSIDMRSGPEELTTLEISGKKDSSPIDLVRTLTTLSYTLASVIECAGPELRGFHPWGSPDASGFRAMACDEILLHTYDAGRGLGLDFIPPADLAEATLERLFPWAQAGSDPWLTLKWANGRIALPDRTKLAKWRWHSAPLREWDGIDPSVSV